VRAWQLGQVTAGYELLEVLGRGGMGVVYKAREVTSGQLRALKTIELNSGAQQAEERFRREGQAQARVDRHPNVAAVHSAGELEGRGYLVMDLVTGGDLKGRLAREGPLPPEEALRVAIEVGRGLAHAHAHGVLHRDLKPANVLFDEEGRAKLVDFGLARLEGEGTLTKTGQVLGTPAYMPPEQIDDAHRVGPAADVYGLGAVLYAALTGKAPFTGGSVPEVLNKVLRAAPQPPSEAFPGIPRAYDAVVARALAKEPSERYATVADMVGALEDLREGGPTTRRLGGVALAALAGVLALGAWQFGAAPLQQGLSASPSPSPSPTRRARSKRPLRAAPAWRLKQDEALRARFKWVEHTDSGFKITIEGELSARALAVDPTGAQLKAELVLESLAVATMGFPARTLDAEVFVDGRGRGFDLRLRPDGRVADLAGSAAIGALVAEKVPLLQIPGQEELGRRLVRGAYQEQRLTDLLSAAWGLFAAESHWQRPGRRDGSYWLAPGPRSTKVLPHLAVPHHEGAVYRLPKGSASFAGGRVTKAALSQVETFASQDRPDVEQRVEVDFEITLAP